MQTTSIYTYSPWGTLLVLLVTYPQCLDTAWQKAVNVWLQTQEEYFPSVSLKALTWISQGVTNNDKTKIQNKILCFQVCAFSMRLFPVVNQSCFVQQYQNCLLLISVLYLFQNLRRNKTYEVSPSFRSWMHFIISRFWNPSLIKKLVISFSFPWHLL